MAGVPTQYIYIYSPVTYQVSKQTNNSTTAIQVNFFCYCEPFSRTFKFSSQDLQNVAKHLITLWLWIFRATVFHQTAKGSPQCRRPKSPALRGFGGRYSSLCSHHDSDVKQDGDILIDVHSQDATLIEVNHT